MKWLPVFTLFFILAGSAVIAGCMQGTGTTNTSAPSPSTTPELNLEKIALTAVDAPDGFVFVSSRQKSINEISPAAKKLGWRGGYIVQFASTPESGSQPSAITQHITAYPEDAIPGIVRAAWNNDMKDTGLDYTVVPVSGLGDSAFAFIGKSNNNLVARSDNSLVMIDSSAASVSSDIAEILFAKGSTMVVLKMSGTGTNFSVLSDLAKTAYARMP